MAKRRRVDVQQAPQEGVTIPNKAAAGRPICASSDEEQTGVMVHGEVAPHPFGARPGGNMILLSAEEQREETIARTNGLGILAKYTDDVVLEILSLLPPSVLGRLAMTSVVLRAYVLHDELWRPHALRCIREHALSSCRKKGDSTDTHEIPLSGSWHNVFVAYQRLKKPVGTQGQGQVQPLPPPLHILQRKGLCSDTLYQPWFLSRAQYPCAWFQHESVPKRDNLSAMEFRKHFEEINIPVVIRGWTKGWKAHERWTCNEFKSARLRHEKLEVFDEYTGPIDISLGNYVHYAETCTAAERPLYMFEPWYIEKVPEFATDYTVPPAFQDDLFAVLGDKRPDFRWLLMGPRGSGAPFHQDPNCTAAWNAVISGRKKWILFPPNIRPPGVHPTGDVDASSVVDWFHRYYYQIEQQHKAAVASAGYVDGDDCAQLPRNRPWECTVAPGEIIFIPHGWWHMALNTELTIAVTHNFVSRVNMGDVAHFLRTRREQTCPTTRHVLSTALRTGPDVSEHSKEEANGSTQTGTAPDAADLYTLFMKGLKDAHPKMHDAVVHGKSFEEDGQLHDSGDAHGSIDASHAKHDADPAAGLPFTRNSSTAIMQQTTHKDKVTPFSFNF
eukprot:m.318964 g.318964  ORF g.318964 m.318964 type:complete len:614 (+) comp20295_c0_seq2:249-2090(+)